MFDKNLKRYEKMAKKEGKKTKKKRRKKKRRTKQLMSAKSLAENVIEEVDEDENASEDEGEEESIDDEEEAVKLTPLEQECKYTLSKLEEKYPQTNMNGKKNIWIVKPAGLSRGRGIELFSSFHEIYHHLKTRDFSWVI
jgi:tubulin monoglycylase TTLL3/8